MAQTKDSSYKEDLAKHEEKKRGRREKNKDLL